MSSNNTKPTTRDEIRANIFNAKPISEQIDFFGATIELRQPPLGTVLDNRAQEDQEQAAIQMLLNYSYVPGTDERVFEEADAEMIRQIPFGEDMQRLLKAVNKLLGVDMEGLSEAVSKAAKSPSAGSPATDGNEPVRSAA